VQQDIAVFKLLGDLLGMPTAVGERPFGGVASPSVSELAQKRSGSLANSLATRRRTEPHEPARTDPGVVLSTGQPGRRTLQAESATGRFPVDSALHRQVSERFIEACTGGDLEGLLVLLDPAVEGEGDTVPGVAVGADEVAREYCATSVRRPPPRCCTCLSAIGSASS